MSTQIQDCLSAVKSIILASSLNTDLESRVWVQPYDSASISKESFPFAVISKMNAEVGTIGSLAYGVNNHTWEILVAIYIAEGPILPNNTEQRTIDALSAADSWYTDFSAVISDNMKLNGTVDIVGDFENQTLMEYVTDNIIWDTRQYFGHLFRFQVTQTINQTYSD